GGPRYARGVLVDLEVHVRVAQHVRALPAQVEERLGARAGAQGFRGLIEAGQVALVGRDRAGDDVDISVVFFGPFAERVVVGAARLIDACVQARDVLPVSGAVCRRVGQQVAVRPGESARAERVKAEIGGAAVLVRLEEVTACPAIRGASAWEGGER